MLVTTYVSNTDIIDLDIVNGDIDIESIDIDEVDIDDITFDDITIDDINIVVGVSTVQSSIASPQFMCQQSACLALNIDITTDMFISIL